MMTALQPLIVWTESVYPIVLRASIEGTVFAVLVWGICRGARRLPAAVRCMLWWLVGLRLLLGLAWVNPVTLPILPADVAMTGAVRTADDWPDLRLTDGRRAEPAGRVAAAAPARRASWRGLIALVWSAALALIAGSVVRSIRRTRSVLAAARPADESLRQVTRSLAARVGVTNEPDIRVSSEIEAPMVVGLRCPVIVLPAHRFGALSADHQQMALAHELVHLRRGDLWLGCVPAIAERLFFFHPLARYAGRQYLLAREAACDAAVVRLLKTTPQHYGQLLLVLGVAPLDARFAASGAPRSFSNLKWRLTMLDHVSPSRRTRIAGWAIAATAACAVVPFQLVARPSAAPVAASQAHDSALPALHRTSDSDSRATAERSQSSAPARNRRPEFALIRSDGNMLLFGSIDTKAIERWRQGSERLLWFRRNGKEYVVRDLDVLDRADDLYLKVDDIAGIKGEIAVKQKKAAEKLGKKAAKSDAKNGALGKGKAEFAARREQLVGRKGELRGRQGALSARQTDLTARGFEPINPPERRELELAERDLRAEMETLEREMAELELETRELERELDAMTRDMEEVEQPEDLTAEMTALSEEMEILTRSMEEAYREADREMHRLLDRLIAGGAAQQVR